jgi:hypothetical protein
MSKLRHQHFIPRSYLKNFSVEIEKKNFVQAKLKSEGQPRPDLISIKDICVEKNLYTIPNTDEESKYSLERFYAEHVDSIYPWIYNILIDPQKKYISENEREKIILITMSLFFRTPKFLNFKERRLDSILKHAINNWIDKHGNVKFSFGEYNLDFNIKDIDEVRSKLKLGNKLKFLHNHLETWHKFTQYKLNAGISVFHIYDDIDLITGDNPVLMHSVSGRPFDIFDPTNIIEVPLDNKHFLTIFPNTESSITNMIFRGERNRLFALTTNLDIEENCDDWILGKPDSITKHIKDQIKYGAYTEENLVEFEILKEKAYDALELSKLVDQVGTIAHPKIVEKVKRLRKKKIYQDDPEFQKIILDLARLGFLTI